MAYQDETSESPSHSFGVAKGEERSRRKPRGRKLGHTRDSRDATSINADCRAPIDSRMPNLPPA